MKKDLKSKKKSIAYALKVRTIEQIEWAAECADCSRSEIVQDALNIYFDMIRRGRYGKTGSAAEESRTE